MIHIRRQRVGLRRAFAVSLSAALLAGVLATGASADPGPPQVVPGSPGPFDPTKAGKPPKPATHGDRDLAKKPGARLPSMEGHVKPGRPPRAAAGRGDLGVWIKDGYGITAVYAEHYMPLTVEIPSASIEQDLFAPALGAPGSCLESVTAHYRLVGDVTRHGHGFYDVCSRTWLSFIPFDANMQATYLSNGRLLTQIAKSGTTWYGSVYDWGEEVWRYWATTNGDSPGDGWSIYEPVNLESTSCPNVPDVRSANMWVSAAGAWSRLAAPMGVQITYDWRSTAACVRSNYRVDFNQQLWDWTGKHVTPGWLMPLPGGFQTTLTTLPGTGSHSSGVDRYAYDFATSYGQDIVATRAGTVTKVDVGHPEYTGQLGDNNTIRIDHGDGTSSIYAHLKQNSAYVEQRDPPLAPQSVKAGQKLAKVGMSGITSGPHLHFHAFVTGDLAANSFPITFTDILQPQNTTGQVTSDNWLQP